MSYRHIVVNLGNPASSTRARHAAQLAKSHGAFLQGVHYQAERREPGPGVAHAPTSSQAAAALNAEWRNERERETERLRAGFEEALREIGVEGSFVPGNAGTQNVAERLLEDARCADLTIIGKPNGDTDAPKLPQHLVSESGGPVMVLPETMESCPGTRMVAVAWNGSREAARAVRDAMPLIERAGRVQVFMVKPRDSVEASARRLQTMLEHHGVASELLREPSGPRASDTLISRAEDRRADVLVMGAFARARVREMITGGGTTGRLLQHTTLPLLMSQ